MATEMQSNQASATSAPTTVLLDIKNRLDSFKELKDGWADGMQPASEWGNGYGKAPSHNGLEWLKKQFATHYPHDLPRPYLYPTPEGNVEAEWELGPHYPSMEVNLDTCQGEWYCLDLSTDNSYEKDLQLDDFLSWEWLAGELRRLENSTA